MPFRCLSVTAQNGNASLKHICGSLSIAGKRHLFSGDKSQRIGFTLSGFPPIGGNLEPREASAHTKGERFIRGFPWADIWKGLVDSGICNYF